MGDAGGEYPERLARVGYAPRFMPDGAACAVTGQGNSPEPVFLLSIPKAGTYLAAGGYRRDLKYAIDTSMWMTLPAFGPVAYLAVGLYARRRHSEQMSSPRSRAEARRQVDEHAMCINGAFDAMRAQGVGVPVTKAQALRCYLPSTALGDAFNNRRRLCFTRLARALRIHPWPTLTARWTWIALTRSLLGERAFAHARATKLAVAKMRRKKLTRTSR